MRCFRSIPLILSMLFPLVSAVAASDRVDRSKQSGTTGASETPTRVGDAPQPVDPPLPDKVPPPEEPPPTVNIRNVSGAIIEEYRQGDRLYMIRVVPEHGVAYTYLDTDGDGRLEYDGADGPVRPVYYTLYEWE